MAAGHHATFSRVLIAQSPVPLSRATENAIERAAFL
jgi:hypothetical protein